MRYLLSLLATAATRLQAVRTGLSLLMLLLAVPSPGTVIWTDGDPVSLQAAVDAASEWDTVRIRPGAWTYNTGDQVLITKSLRIKGSGAFGPTESNTIITNASTDDVNAIIAFVPTVDNKFFEISGILMVGQWQLARGIGFGGTKKAYNSVHSCVFSNFLDSMVYYSSPTYGVVWSNQFWNFKHCIQVYGSSTSAAVSDGIWAGDLGLGSSNAVYFEDNLFIETDELINNTSVSDVTLSGSGLAARRVFRYNTVSNLVSNFSGKSFNALDAHGNQRAVTNQVWLPLGSGWYGSGGTNFFCDAETSSRHRGAQLSETYGNTFYQPWNGHLFNLRGGVGLFFSNKVWIGTSPVGGDAAVYHREEDAYRFDCWASTTYVQGNETTPGFPWDKVLSFVWDNEDMDGAGTLDRFVAIETASADLLQIGRDIFTNAPPGYVPFTYPHPLRNFVWPDDDPADPPAIGQRVAGTVYVGRIGP